MMFFWNSVHCISLPHSQPADMSLPVPYSIIPIGYHHFSPQQWPVLAPHCCLGADARDHSSRKVDMILLVDCADWSTETISILARSRLRNGTHGLGILTHKKGSSNRKDSRTLEQWLWNTCADVFFHFESIAHGDWIQSCLLIDIPIYIYYRTHIFRYICNNMNIYIYIYMLYTIIFMPILTWLWVKTIASYPKIDWLMDVQHHMRPVR